MENDKTLLQKGMSKRVRNIVQSDAGIVLQPLLCIPDVARILHLSRPKVYDLINCEGLPVMRFGRAVRVSPGALQRWMDKRTA